MSDQNDQDKTEPATPRRLEEARKEGRVARSSDLSTALTIVAMLAAFQMAGPRLFDAMRDGIKGTLHVVPTSTLDGPSVQQLCFDTAAPVAAAFLAFAACVLAMGVGGSLLQTGILFTTKPLEPSLDRINPMSGFGRIFSMQSVGTFCFGLFKLLAVGWIVYAFLLGRRHEFPSLSRLQAVEILPRGGELISALGWRVAAAMLAIGLGDYAFQRWRHEREMRMTKQEIKDEQKQQEGDPHIKQRIRQIQRQRGMKRMMEDVPKATVVITNPTHFAVALRYEAGAMAAPTVVAKGQNLVALKIKALAAEHGVPVQEDKPLARGLFRTVEVGQEIPAEFYQAIAQVLAALRRRNGPAGGSMREARA